MGRLFHPHVIVKTLDQLPALKSSSLLFSTRIPKSYLNSLLGLVFEFLLQVHPHDGDHLHIIRMEFKLIEGNISSPPSH